MIITKYPYGNEISVYGNRLGTLSFDWKVSEEAVETRNSRVILQVSKQIAEYSTREMRRDLIEKYQHFAKTSKSIVRRQFIMI